MKRNYIICTELFTTGEVGQQFCSGFEFCFQCLCDCSQPPVTPVREKFPPLASISPGRSYSTFTAGKTPMHISKSNFFQFFGWETFNECFYFFRVNGLDGLSDPDLTLVPGICLENCPFHSGFPIVLSIGFCSRI